MKTNKTVWTVIIASIAVLIIGLAGFFLFGDNLSQDNSWGLYIALFFGLEAICAGCLFLAAVDKKCNRMTLATLGVISGFGAALAIIVDLGQPFVMWRLFLTPNIMSPVLLDVIFLSACLILGIIFIILLRLQKTGALKVTGILMAIFAVVLPIGTAWLSTSLEGRIGWNSSFAVASFLVQALLAGYLIEVLLSGERNTRLAAIVLSVSGLFVLCEVGLALYTTGISAIPLLALISGEYAVTFWFQFIVGIVVPAIMLFLNKAPKVAAIIGIFGIFIYKYLYVIQGNLFPRLAMGDMLQGSAYFPSVGEWGASLAIVALVVLVTALVMSRANGSPETSKTPEVSEASN